MYEILVNGKKLLFDEEDFKVAKNYNWLINGNDEILARKDNKYYSIQSLVFACPKDTLVYHKNENQYDFRKDHIEIVSRQEYYHIIQSKKKRKNKSSKYNCVFYDSLKKKWGTRVVKDKAHFAGRYPTQEDAAIAADKLIVKLYGDNAERNFPQMSLDELEKKYAELEAKYGKNEKEKRAKSVQGVSVKKTSKTSKYVGVYYEKKRKKWIAEIWYLKKRYRLGYFDKEDDAAKAYDEKARELYGEGARVNLGK